MQYTFALLGNPNSGKTTLFNCLTGNNQHVGNWPGVTIEKKIGKIKNTKYNIIDLPGIYSLSPYSIEEIVTRDYIINENPDIIINILDANNIQRNLYLTLQLIELQKPIICVVNMVDELESNNIKLDCDNLSKLLGIPFIPISAKKKRNIDKITEYIDNIIKYKKKNDIIVQYNNTTLNTINDIISVIPYNKKLPHIFIATKILENDHSIIEIINLTQEQKSKIDIIIKDYESNYKYGDKETIFADARYSFIEKIVNQSISKDESKIKNKNISTSDKIDNILTNKYLGIPIFLIIMYIMFSITFGKFGSFLQDQLDFFFNDTIVNIVDGILNSANAPNWTFSLIKDGIIGGVGGIITFVPQIALLFLFLSILEDTGYIARAAFIMDRLLKKIGLSGKAFIPMLMGFGCTTTAVMSTRTLENEDDRRLTIMLTPFMSCSARFVIYVLFANTFFPKYKNIVVFSMYILGIIVAVISGFILKKTLFKNSSSNFILELPPYRFPNLKSVIFNMYDKSKSFIIRAGNLIFAMSIVIWFLQNFNLNFNLVDNSESILAWIGSLIAPIFIPLGFGTWQASVSLLTGFIAKESVISTMTVIYSISSIYELSHILQSTFNPISAYSFMAFSLLYIPCISAFISIKKEMNSTKWALGTALLQTGSAYIVSLIIFQIGSIIF